MQHEERQDKTKARQGKTRFDKTRFDRTSKTKTTPKPHPTGKAKEGECKNKTIKRPDQIKGKQLTRQDKGNAKSKAKARQDKARQKSSSFDTFDVSNKFF